MIDSSGANNLNFYATAWEYPAKVIAEYRRQKEQAMNNQMTIEQQDALDQWGAHWDEKSFQEIERSDSETAALIRHMVKLGFSPEQIAKEVVKNSPQRWIESQQVLQAARFLTREQQG